MHVMFTSLLLILFYFSFVAANEALTCDVRRAAELGAGRQR